MGSTRSSSGVSSSQSNRIRSRLREDLKQRKVKISLELKIPPEQTKKQSPGSTDAKREPEDANAASRGAKKETEALTSANSPTEAR